MKTAQEFMNAMLKEFIAINDDPNEMILWKNRAIIELMDFAKLINNSNLIQEGLLIIMSLYDGFLKISELPPSCEIYSLSADEKAEVDSILTQEFC